MKEKSHTQKVNIDELEKVSGGVKSRIVDSIGSGSGPDGVVAAYAKGGYSQYGKSISIDNGHGTSTGTGGSS